MTNDNQLTGFQISMKKTVVKILIWCSLFLTNIVFAQQITVVTTSAAGDRLSVKEKVDFNLIPVPSKDPMLVVDENEILIHPHLKFQQMDGFGASFLEAGMICANSLEMKEKQMLFQSLFDTVQGAGFSVMKSPLAGNDFMSAGEWYSYNDTPGDTAMKNFSIERDLKPNGLITYIKEARKYGHFIIQSPMDYPPDWMLTNIEDQKNQDVDEKYFPAIAKYYLRYIQEYKKQGVNIDYLSLFNEPGIYTKISYSKIETLLADHVGPLFKENHIETKIQMCEANHRLYGWNYFPQVLQNENAAQTIGGLAFHGYDYQRNFDKIAELKQNYPQFPIWMTEVCHAYVCGYPRSKPLPNYDYSDGDYWGNEIISDLESGVSGWIYWNMILDENGGPWLVSEHHGNPDFNAQQPVVVVNRKDKTVHYTALYYYLSHFSRYIRPGYVRIGTYENIDGIRTIAFLSPENKVILEVLNSTGQNKEIKIRIDNQQAGLTIPATSINTLIFNMF